MAEIKSALELAMERTKKIAISQKEKEEIKRKEILRKVDGLFHRYMEGHLPLNEILREIDRMDEKKRTMVKEILLSQWIDALSLNEEDERLFKGIEALKGRHMDGPKEKFHHLLSQYQEEKERTRQELKAKIAGSLKKERIWGSAVEPNVEGSRIWKEELEGLNHLCGVKLKDLKEQLRAL